VASRWFGPLNLKSIYFVNGLPVSVALCLGYYNCLNWQCDMVPHLFQKMEFPQKGDIHIFSFLLYLNSVITPYLLPFLTAALYTEVTAGCEEIICLKDTKRERYSSGCWVGSVILCILALTQASLFQ